MRDHYWCQVDRRTCIVMRQNKAVALGLVQFAIFDTLHRVGNERGRQMPSSKLCDEIYRGTREPGTLEAMRVAISGINRKLKHIGLRIRGNNHGVHSFYQIVIL